MEEAWSKIKQDVSHFCVFGFEAWAHISDEKWKALQLKVKSAYLLDILKM